MRASRVNIILTIALTALLSCSAPTGEKPATAEKPNTGWGFDTASLDKKAEPCTDFFQFANGGWIAKNPIPPEYSSWGRFNELDQRNIETLHKILEDVSKNTSAPKGSIEQKVGDFYASCMDESKIEADGLKPLESEIARIDKIADGAALQEALAHLTGLGVSVGFSFNAAEDPNDSSKTIADASQGGVGLFSRDYYFKEDDDKKKIREAYVKHVAKMLELLGADASKTEAESKAVLALETKLYEKAMDPVELRDPKAQNNRMDLASLKTLTPSFSWPTYLEAVGIPQIDSLNVSQPKYFKNLDAQVKAIPIDDWKAFLKWRLVSTASPSLPKKFRDEHFNFYDKLISGKKEQLPRWKECVQQTDENLGEALGQLYIKVAFPPESKRKMLELIGNLRAVLHEDLTKLEWMTEPTRKQATAKLEAIVEKIGYPDKWRDYSQLEIVRGAHIQNSVNAAIFEFKRRMNKVGKPTDRSEWLITPPTVNAYYYPPNNEIVFPAGILQPPFFDPNADDAVNYGAIGMVIGHEITHGFDDQGSQFDAKGNLKNWWTDEDRKNFEERSKCVETQFSGYKVEEGLNVNGKLTLGENIADLGGLRIAYAAYIKSLEGKPRPKDIDGFNPEQRFFLGFAQVWASNMTPEQARLLVSVNPHSPPKFRVNGPLANLEIFAKAFSCKEGTMTRSNTELCKIW